MEYGYIIFSLINLFIILFVFFYFKKEKEQYKTDLDAKLNTLQLNTEQYISKLKDNTEYHLSDLKKNSFNIEKDISKFDHLLSSIKDSSEKSSKDLHSLFNNGKSVGQIGEEYLYSILIQLGCIELKDIHLNNDDDILLYLVSNNIKFGFKRQVLVNNGSIPDCIIYTAIKISDDEFSLKKVIVDSKAIINSLNLKDGDELTDKLIAQMKGLSKKEYFKGIDNSFNNVILFFPFIGLLDLLKENSFSLYKDMLFDFKSKGIVFSTVENIYLTLEIILDGYNSHQLQETSNSKDIILEKSKEIENIQKQFKHGLKERINSSDLVSYLNGTIKREIAIYKYLLQYEDDIDNNKEIQFFLDEIKTFK